MHNGEKPAIEVFWDAEKQAFQMKFDPEQIKNWTFCKAVLEMAAKAAEREEQMQYAMALQQRAMQEAQNQGIAQKIMKGR